MCAFKGGLQKFDFQALANLHPYEVKWKGRQQWLLQHGFELRRRFRTDWVPSWRKYEWMPNWFKYGVLNPLSREDSIPLEFGEVIMDAVRVSDGAYVAMKLVDTQHHPSEVPITTFFSSPDLVKDPRNHCVPILDTFVAPDDPTRSILVMPLLKRFDRPPFETVGEVIDCLEQLFTGLNFMHIYKVAHRDCGWPNIMMDAAPLYPVPYHPAEPTRTRDWRGRAHHFSRTVRPVRYYFIDYGLSAMYDPEQDSPRDFPVRPGDDTVPEHQGHKIHELADPFATDVYLLGHAIQERFTERTNADTLRFIEPLLADMTADDPESRPRMREVVARFADLKGGLDATVLSSPLSLDGVVYNASLPEQSRALRLK